MYEAYWELSEPPFDNSPNPKFFYLSPEHEEALVRLVYTVRHRKGCGMLTGEYGCGKTTLSRALIQRLEAERYEIGLLTNPSWNATDFLREALYQLGVESKEKSKSELLHLLNDVFFRNYRDGRDTVIIVDEAQLIADDGVFEEVRLLMNFQTDDRFLVTLLLIGSPELRERVRRLKHLDQRITIRYHLNTLDYTHTAAYVSHRLKMANRATPIFTEAAIKPLFAEIQEFLVEVHGLLRGGGGFPWARLQALVDRAITALARSADLFWVANNPAAPPAVDYIAFHQARVCVLALRIGGGVGYDRVRLTALGQAAALFDVALWQMPDSILRRVDALSGEELALWRSHPRQSAEIVRRCSPPHHRRGRARDRRQPQPSAAAESGYLRRRQGPAPGRREDARPLRGAVPVHHRPRRRGRTVRA